MWRDGPRDGELTEGCERGDEAVMLADPINQPIATGIGDQHIPSSTTEGAILDVDIDGIGPEVVAGSPVAITVGLVVVIGIHQVVAEAAKHLVVIRTAHEPVVAEIAEHHVLVEVVVLIGVDVGIARRIKIQQEGLDLASRIKLVVVSELDPVLIEAEEVVVALRMDRIDIAVGRIVRVDRKGEELGQRLGA